jgi:hypothetical protein
MISLLDSVRVRPAEDKTHVSHEPLKEAQQEERRHNTAFKK